MIPWRRTDEVLHDLSLDIDQGSDRLSILAVQMGQEAATPKLEVKSHWASSPSNDCMPVPPGSYSASNFAGAA